MQSFIETRGSSGSEFASSLTLEQAVVMSLHDQLSRSGACKPVRPLCSLSIEKWEESRPSLD